MDDIVNRAKKIRLAIFDVDGVLTDGTLFYGTSGIEYKAFNVNDGLGIRMLQKSGIVVAIITAKQSDIVTRRMHDLDVTHIYQNQSEKIIAYNDLKKKLNLSDEEIAYTGDDLPDLPLLRRAGLSITVPNAPALIQQYAHWITTTAGGKGAVREISEFILQAQNNYAALIEKYLA